MVPCQRRFYLPGSPQPTILIYRPNPNNPPTGIRYSTQREILPHIGTVSNSPFCYIYKDTVDVGIMAQLEYSNTGRRGMMDTRAIQNQPTNVASLMASEEDLLADVDEPPDLDRTPRPSTISTHDSLTTPFTKARPSPTERKASLLTSALHSDGNSMVEEEQQSTSLRRGMSCVSTWSNNSATTAELTSDGGFTSPGTRTSTPSPPLPQSAFHTMVPIFNKKPFDQPVSVVRHDEDNIGPLQKPEPTKSGEQGVEVTLGRKRCISFACGRKAQAQPSPESKMPTTKPEPTLEAPKPKRACAISFACGPRPQTKASAEAVKPATVPVPAVEAPKRVCTISFACPSKVSTDTPPKTNRLRFGRAASPAPMVQRQRASSKASVRHRDSDSTVRTMSPISIRKAPLTKDRCRRLSGNSDLARTEAYRFHEFASSEEEIEDWTLESTCHRSRLTVSDTLRIENNLRQLAEEAEEEALDEDEDDELDEEVDAESDDDDDDEEEEEEEEEELSDEGFQTDDEEGFAGSDDESDAGSDFNWWAPGAAYSTAATSLEHLEQIRPSVRRSISESSDGSVDSDAGFKMPAKPLKRRKSRPVNIRAPSPELPDSTDFVCGTLDEDRPLEDAYLTCLERRRAAKHKITPQDIDPTFPTSDPEMDEEDEDDEPEVNASESDQHVMMHGQMDHLDGEHRGRAKGLTAKRSPATSPRRMRSPPPVKRVVHRSPPPRKLFGNSPRRARSPAPGVRLRSPPPTRRGSEIMSPHRPTLNVRFGGLAERPALTFSSSVPRTPLTLLPLEDMDGEETCRENPARGAINIKVGLEKKRQRRREQLYKKTHRKGVKEKRPAPGKGCERMREMGIGLAAYRGKTTGFGFGFGMQSTPDQKDMLVLSL